MFVFVIYLHLQLNLEDSRQIQIITRLVLTTRRVAGPPSLAADMCVCVDVRFHKSFDMHAYDLRVVVPLSISDLVGEWSSPFPFIFSFSCLPWLRAPGHCCHFQRIDSYRTPYSSSVIPSSAVLWVRYCDATTLWPFSSLQGGPSRAAVCLSYRYI